MKMAILMIKYRRFTRQNLLKQVVTTKADRLFKSVSLKCLIMVHEAPMMFYEVPMMFSEVLLMFHEVPMMFYEVPIMFHDIPFMFHEVL